MIRKCHKQCFLFIIEHKKISAEKMYNLKSTSKVFVHSEFHDSNTSPKIWMGPTKGWKTKSY